MTLLIYNIIRLWHVFLAQHKLVKIVKLKKIKIRSSSVKRILLIYKQQLSSVTSIIVLLPWKPHRWHWTHSKLSKCNQYAIKCLCILWKIIHNGLLLMKLCQPVRGVRFFETQCSLAMTFDLLTSKCNQFIFVRNCTEVIN